MDEATCNKFKALSVLRKGSMYGGQGQLITMLIEQELANTRPHMRDTKRYGRPSVGEGAILEEVTKWRLGDFWLVLEP